MQNNNETRTFDTSSPHRKTIKLECIEVGCGMGCKRCKIGNTKGKKFNDGVHLATV